MSQYGFSQSWLSKVNDPNEGPTALEFAHLRAYLNGIDNGTIPLFNLNLLNSTITNLTIAGNIAMGGFKLTGLGAGSANGDSLRYEQLIGQYLPIGGGTLTGNLGFNPTTKGIIGSNTNDTATAGNVGEIISAQVITFANTGATGVTSDITSISLTAGTWVISVLGTLKYNGATITNWIIGIGTVSGNDLTNVTDGTTRADGINPNAVETQITLAIPVYPVFLASTTTFYLKVDQNFSAGQPQAAGRILAVRIR